MQEMTAFLSPAPLRASPLPMRANRCHACKVPMACAEKPAGKVREKDAKKSGAPVLDLGALQSEVESALEDGLNSVSAAATLRDVEDARVKYMGKKGLITSVMKSVGRLEPAQRPVLGASVNKAKNEFNESLGEKKAELEEAAAAEKERRESEDDTIDVTLPGFRRRPHTGRIHPLNAVMDLATDIFIDLGYDLIDELSPYNQEIEDDWFCFEALNCPPDHPARDMQDTLYMKEDKKKLLRTQTSAMQIRYMMDPDNEPPFAIIAPGRVYRRDAVDATHSPVFHQIEILHVRKIGELTLGSLKATIVHFLEKMLGEGIETRFRGSYFPFTEPSMEVDVFFKGKWLEVLGCGMVDPSVLEKVGIDPDEYVGFAAGFGVERFAMVMTGLPDIRELYKSDIRYLMQGNIESHNFDQIPRSG